MQYASIYMNFLVTVYCLDTKTNGSINKSKTIINSKFKMMVISQQGLKKNGVIKGQGGVFKAKARNAFLKCGGRYPLFIILFSFISYYYRLNCVYKYSNVDAPTVILFGEMAFMRIIKSKFRRVLSVQACSLRKGRARTK